MPIGFYQGRPSRRFACVFNYAGTPSIERFEGPIIGCCAVDVQVGPSDDSDITLAGERAIAYLIKLGIVAGREHVVQIHARLDRTVGRDEMRVEARTSAPPAARIGLATRAKIAATNRRRASQRSAA